MATAVGEELAGGFLLTHADKGHVDDRGDGVSREYPAWYEAERYIDGTLKQTVGGHSMKELEAAIERKLAEEKTRKRPVGGEEGSSLPESANVESRVIVSADDSEPEVEEDPELD